MSKSHQCQEVLVILLLMFTIWETILHKHNYLPLDLSVLPLFQGLILEPVRTGTQTFLSMQPYLYPFQSYAPMAGVDKESSEDAAFYLAMIQADRQVWPVSHLKHVKFSVVNTIVCVCAHTHTCCASLHIHISPSVYYNLSAWMHPTALIMRTCRVLYQVFHEAFGLWYSPTEQFPVHVTLSMNPCLHLVLCWLW